MVTQIKKYGLMLKETYPDLILDIYDLFLLQDYQIETLPQRIEEEMLQKLLQTYLGVYIFFCRKTPCLEPFFSTLANRPRLVRLTNNELVELLWEIADLIIYNKDPALFDSRADFGLDFGEVTKHAQLEGKVVLDGGAGSGYLTFKACACCAKAVVAVEPNPNLRRFMIKKIVKQGLSNVFVLDGFLSKIPVPNNFVDVVLTSHAIGWNLPAELAEIERVLKPGGSVVHFTGYSFGEPNPIHETITTIPWNYGLESYEEKTGLKCKYWKTKEAT